MCTVPLRRGFRIPDYPSGFARNSWLDPIKRATLSCGGGGGRCRHSARRRRQRQRTAARGAQRGPTQATKTHQTTAPRAPHRVLRRWGLGQWLYIPKTCVFFVTVSRIVVSFFLFLFSASTMRRVSSYSCSPPRAQRTRAAPTPHRARSVTPISPPIVSLQFPPPGKGGANLTRTPEKTGSFTG